MQDFPYIPAKGEKLALGLDFYPGGIVLPIDKPYGWTSADVIRKVKFAAVKHFGKKNLKIGHAGTLDPLATGVLIVCIGKATKLAETFQAHDKEYLARVTFGATTPSYDLEKEIDRIFPYEHVTEESVREALNGFLGLQEQVAPLFSAKSVEGVRAYEIARKMMKAGSGAGASGSSASGADMSAGASAAMASGEAEVSADMSTGAAIDEAAAQMIRKSQIRINEIELVSFTAEGKAQATPAEEPQPDVAVSCGPVQGDADLDAVTPGGSVERKGPSSRINITDNSALGLPEALIRISCSKGTYIRALARDLGEALNTGAHLSGLIRTRSGDFSLAQALKLEDALNLF